MDQHPLTPSLNLAFSATPWISGSGVALPSPTLTLPTTIDGLPTSHPPDWAHVPGPITAMMNAVDHPLTLPPTRPGPLSAAMAAANPSLAPPGPLTAACLAAAPGPLTAAMNAATNSTLNVPHAMMSPGISSGLAGGAATALTAAGGPARPGGPAHPGSVDLAQLFMAPEYAGSYGAGAGAAAGATTTTTTATTTATMHAGQKHVADVAEPAERRVKKARVLGPRAGEAVAARGSAVEQAQRAAAAKADRFADERKMQRAVVSSGGEEEVVEEGDAHLAPDELRKKRYLRRLELNRQSAAVSRVRRREYVKELEDKLVGVESEKHRLQGQVDTMSSENMRLRTQMRNLQAQLVKPERR